MSTALILLLSASLLTACGGKKTRAEKASAQQAEPSSDITYPPTIIKDVEVESES